jgi:uracil-DNA glycosylase
MTAAVDARKLLIKIARCPNVQRCLASDERHPCRRVVAAQNVPDLPRFPHQLPEPWSGHIETAPILFVGSNPSLDPSERFPTKGWADQRIEAFFTARFDRGLPPVRYWSVVRSIARAILGEEPRPGHDFALTELVRCKSWNEKGVPQALETCSDLYLERTFKVAGAKVVVALGKVAREGIASHIGGASKIGLRGTFDIGGRERAVLMLGHPSSGQRQTPTKAEVKKLRPVLPPR